MRLIRILISLFLRAYILIFYCFAKEKSICERLQLIFLMFKIFVLVRLLKKRTIGLFGLIIETGHPQYFFYTFCEVFIFEVYANDKESELIFDCGANIGLSAIYFKLKNPMTRIVAFEPEPYAFDCLKMNIERNKFKDIELHQVALSDVVGTCTMFVNEVVPSDPHSNLLEVSAGCVGQIEVTTTQLSNYMTENIDLLKMDIEGVEEKVILDLVKSKKISYVQELILEQHNPNSKLKDILEQESFVVEEGQMFNNRYDGHSFLHAMRSI